MGSIEPPTIDHLQQSQPFRTHLSGKIFLFVTLQGRENFKGATTKLPNKKNLFLKTLDTIGYCQRLVLTVGVSQHTHKMCIGSHSEP